LVYTYGKTWGAYGQFGSIVKACSKVWRENRTVKTGIYWVLAHIPVKRDKGFLREVGRVLKSDAWLMISDSYWRGQEGGKEQVQVRSTDEGVYEVYKVLL
jgi:hypothetical protein